MTRGTMEAIARIPENIGECEGCRREDAIKIATCKRCSGTGNEPNWIVVPVYVCPNCQSYYAASSAGNLAKQPIHSITGEDTGMRAQCSYCHAQGIASDRVRVEVLVPVPVT